MVLLCATILFINYMDRGTLSMAAPLIQKDLGIDDRAMGTLLSAFFWSYALMQVPIGWLAERYGGHRILAVGLAVWAGATVLTGAVSSLVLLLVLRMLLGLGESAGFPCMSKVLTQTVPPKGLGFANGIVGFAYLFGPAAGSYFGGYLMAAYGWRSAFFVFGAVSLVWLIPWARVGPPLRESHALHVADAPAFGEILRKPALWGTGLGLFSTNYAFYFMLTWLPSYLVRERGFSTIEMGQINGYAFLINALAAVLAGWGTDRLIARGVVSATGIYKGIMAVAHVGTVICLLGMALAGKPVALTCMFIYQALCGASSPGVYAMSQILAGPKAAGRWVGVQNTMGSLAGVVSPYVTGRIIDATHSFTNALLVAAAVAALGLVGWIAMIPKLHELQWTSRPRTAVASALT